MTDSVEPTSDDAPPTLSGVDLARVALRNARQASRMRQPDQVARRGPVVGRQRGVNGRDPLTLGASVLSLIAERAWEVPVAGGEVLNAWARLVPQLAETVRAVAFDASTGRLDLLPYSPAYATQARLLAAGLIEKLNRAQGVDAQVVREIRVLSPGYVPTLRLATDDGTTSPAVPEDTTSAGASLAMGDVRRPTRQQRPVPPEVAAAIERQTLAMAREPEHAFREGQVQAEEDRARAEREDNAGDLYRRARVRALGERRSPPLASASEGRPNFKA